MTSSEAPTVGGFHWLECGNQVEKVDGGKNLSFDLHKLSHINVDTRIQEVDRPSSNSFGKSNSSSRPRAPYTCHICNEQVEVLYNDIKLSLKIHSKKHSNQPGMPFEDQLSDTSSSTNKKSTKKIIKVKNKQKVVDSTIIDDAFITLPPCLRAHRGFILKNADGVIFCNICRMNVDILSISEHLKTKRHEDNTILLLKNFTSDDLHSSLDCLAFSGSSLVCNLCNCKIDLCSSNPYETIVNVFVHNAQNIHLSKKSSGNRDLNWKSDDAHRILQTLSEISPVISENRTYLDVKVQPNFNCKLCSQHIAYDEDNTALLDNLNSHLIGQDHAKYRNAAFTLQLFETSNIHLKENHMLVVSKGSIYCKRCFCNIPSDTKLIEEHVKSCPATRINKNDPFFKQVEEVLINVPSLVRSSAVKKTHVVQELKYLQGVSKESQFKNVLGIKIATVQKVKNEDEDSVDIKANGPIDITSLLSSMPLQFRDVGYLVEDNDGKAVKCLVCDCRIPPAHYNVETHLTGRKHQTNEDKMKTGSNMFGEATASLSVLKPETPNLVDQVFENLTRNDPVVKANDIILMDFGDGMHYFCTACGDLIPTSTDSNTFKSNIYQHVKSATHLHRFPHHKQIIGANALPKDRDVSTIDELFAALTKDLQGDRQFIKPHRHERSSLYCSLCKVKVPNHVRNLQEHLEGGYHTDLYDTFSAPQDFFSKAVGFAVGAIKDAIFHKITMSDKLIKDNEKHLSRKGEDYFCVLCTAKIKNCNDPEELTERFLSHLEGNNHIQNVVIKLLESNPGIRDEKSYVKVKNQIVHCSKCDIALPRGFEETNLKKHIFAHFSGNRHSNSTNSSQIPSSSSKPFNLPKTPNCSTMLNQPTDSNNPLTSSHHFQVSSNTTVPRPLIDCNTSYSFNPVFEAFRNVPTHLQIDMKYIKPGTTPDFLTCTLCSKTINPFYLKDHLVEETHLKEKRIFEERVSHWKMRVM